MTIRFLLIVLLTGNLLPSFLLLTMLSQFWVESYIEHPNIIHMYNKYMGGVDCNDQLLKYSAFSHRTCKWWKKVLFRLLNLAMVNAYITYSEWVALKGKKKLSQTSFWTEVRKQMIKSAALDLSRPTPGRPSTSGLDSSILLVITFLGK